MCKKAGYLYIYVANESMNGVEAYFDDISVEHIESKVSQVADYYPFGLRIKQTSTSITSPQANKYLYNGKELQTDLNLDWYDYGMRFYDPALARWHSVDPLTETYSSWSPYHYAMNNPIRYTDVFGMGAGDFYDENGKFLGTDGVDDGKKYVVTDKQEKLEIKSTNKEGGTTQVSDVSSAKQLPSDAALTESLNVLERTESNGGLREESSKVMTDGTVARGETGEMPTIKDGVQTAETNLPATPAGKDVEATIHSHPTKVQIEEDKAYPQTATNPSGVDKTTFKNYGTNIIVGNLSQPSVTKNTYGSYTIGSATKGAVIYNSKTQAQIQLTKKAIKRILK